MAHSNHYFHMVVRNADGYIDLLARTPEYGEVGEIFDNMIQLIVKGPVYGTTEQGEIGIWLTEQEQDDLIHAIYERRGLRWCGGGSKPAYKERFFNYVETEPIHAEGDQQSYIHPAKK
jgi:hypothetical protein